MTLHRNMIKGMLSLVAAVVLASGMTLHAAVSTTKVGAANSSVTEEEASSHVGRMHMLELLADNCFGTPQELVFLKKIYHMSNTGGKRANEFRALAISHICRHYYNSGQFDSVQVWAKHKSEIELMPETHAFYFDACYYDCSATLEDGSVEKALGKALNMQKEARRLESDDGEVTCYEMLGDIYMKTKIYNEAIEAYACGYKILAENKMRPTYRFQFLTQIMECCYDGSDQANFSKYLREMGRIFWNDEIKVNQGALYYRCLKLYYAYALIEGVLLESNSKADTYFAKMNALAAVDDWFVEDRCISARAVYYSSLGNYNAALSQLNMLDSSTVGTYYDLLYSKGNLYERLDNYPMALNCFVESYDSLEAAYNRSVLSEFGEFQEVCRDQYATRIQSEYEQERQSRNIMISTAFLAVMLVLLALFGYHVRRATMLNSKLLSTGNRLRADEQVLMQRQEVLRDSLERHKSNGRMKSMFLSRMSHEIRTPLNAIVGFSNLLMENAGVSDEEREYVNIIRRNSDSLMLLINNILDLGRLDSNRVMFNFAKCDLMAVIDTALAPYGNSEVKSEVKSGELYIEVESDATQLSRVFGHVYSNAFKFTSQGSVTTVVCADDDEMVMVRVEDTGIGVPDDKKEAIFERFEKVDVFVQGSGLGLSICREIMKNLGGKIYVDKQYTGGLAVVIEIPRHHTDKPDDSEI